jgi:hypothetical protein
MSGYLKRLVARTLGRARVVRPRLAPQFGSPWFSEEFVEAPADELKLEPFAIRGDRIESSAGAPSGRVDVAVEPDGIATQHRAIAEGNVQRQAIEIPDRMETHEKPRIHQETKSAERAEARENAAIREPAASQRPEDAIQMENRDDVVSLRAAPTESRDAPGRAEPPARPLVAAQRSASVGESNTSPPGSRGEGEPLQENSLPALPRTRERSAPVPLARLIVAGSQSAPASRARSLTTGARTKRERAESDATIVNVTIDRIEVRSPPESAGRTIRRESPPAPKPRDQLDTYLRARGAPNR